MTEVKKKKVEHLIVDTSAFIKNASLQEIGENILTVPEVVKEITSKRQLRRLVVLPYDLTVKETFPEHVKFVTEFSKRTGDYPSLSATDIQVIALTYQLEKEKAGIEHLNQVPAHKIVIEPSGLPSDDYKDVAGFYLPDKGEHCHEKPENDTEDEIENDISSEYLSADDGEDEDNTFISDDLLKGEVVDDERSGSGREDGNEGDCGGEYDVDDDDEGWITPSNIQEMKKKVVGDLEEEAENTIVACLTMDYAMQNVLKQIGLKVVSLDGKLIKEVRTFILRCYGCFKTTSIMTKVFCPNCGNKTLKKVAVSLNPDGTQKLHINFKRPLTARGKKFSVPRFQGGKHSSNPLICEDQPVPQERASRLARAKTNALEDDYIAGYSPFVMRDVNSKSAMLGIRPVKQWMRSNPNEVRRNSKKNKKK